MTRWAAPLPAWVTGLLGGQGGPQACRRRLTDRRHAGPRRGAAARRPGARPRPAAWAARTRPPRPPRRVETAAGARVGGRAHRRRAPPPQTVRTCNQRSHCCTLCTLGAAGFGNASVVAADSYAGCTAEILACCRRETEAGCSEHCSSSTGSEARRRPGSVGMSTRAHSLAWSRKGRHSQERCKRSTRGVCLRPIAMAD